LLLVILFVVTAQTLNISKKIILYRDYGGFSQQILSNCQEIRSLVPKEKEIVLLFPSEGNHLLTAYSSRCGIVSLTGPADKSALREIVDINPHYSFFAFTKTPTKNSILIKHAWDSYVWSMNLGAPEIQHSNYDFWVNRV
jgi:hypothetical protein